MFAVQYDRSEPTSRRDSPSTSGSNTPSFSRPPVSLPPIGTMFGTDEYRYPRQQWFQGLDTRSASSSPESPATGSPTFAYSSTSSTSTAPAAKSSPGSPFSDKAALPTREWTAPVTVPVPPSDAPALSASPAPSPPPAPPQRRRGKLPKHVTETLRTWLLSHADHPYPTEEEKKMLCNVTSLTLSQVSNWMINARRRILVPASKQQAALNATTGPYMGIARSSAATDLARANRQSVSIPHVAPTHALPPSLDPYAGAYSLPHDMHRSSYPLSLSPRSGPAYAYPAPTLNSYYGAGLPLGYPAAPLVQPGPGRYYPDDSHPYSAH
ncbi:Homeobox protein [Ceratobasidium theobromae]|uniref:Homeobox protein n=1 Tax=Ceratobasidium theobromae TaxID=1582974 RepID=A0A5N5QGI2_9AGAM|nr:Homeobox protein [Ceratobasidium theobromae]